jgi:type IV pilus assembly protein PilE
MLRQYSSVQNESGFTLVELIIVIAIVGILSSIAYPSYMDSVKKGHIADALAELSNAVFNMEQSYQNNRTYRDPADATKCGVADFSTDQFSFSCVSGSRSTFTWTASNKAGSMSAVNSYIYNVDQDNVKKTLAYDGSAVAYTEWYK